MIGPHPRRPTREGVQNFLGAAAAVRQRFDVAIYLIAIRPVALDGDEAEAFFRDEALRDLGSPRIELRRAVGRLAQQHEASVADGLEERIQVRGGVERPCHPSQRRGLNGSFGITARFVAHLLAPPLRHAGSIPAVGPQRTRHWSTTCGITMHEHRGGYVPETETIERAKEDAREGKAPSTQAGEFVRGEIHHVREGKHGARSTKQAIAIGLSKARRAGVRLPPPKKGKAKTKKSAASAYRA